MPVRPPAPPARPAGGPPRGARERTEREAGREGPMERTGSIERGNSRAKPAADAETGDRSSIPGEIARSSDSFASSQRSAAHAELKRLEQLIAQKVVRSEEHTSELQSRLHLV